MSTGTYGRGGAGRGHRAMAIVQLGKTWISRSCVDCRERKPLFTAYCDTCAGLHGLGE